MTPAATSSRSPRCSRLREPRHATCRLRKLAEPAISAHHGGVTAGLRERKKLATRLALHEAALRLVAERGLDRVSVDDIATAADASPRTFFNYFATKDDAVIGIDPTEPARLAAACAARPAHESAVEALRAVEREQAAAM